MQKVRSLTYGLLMIVLPVDHVMAQAMGEYGRNVGAIGQRQSNVGAAPSSARFQNSKSKTVVEGMENIGGRSIPSALVVASPKAVLYPRQDDEAEKVANLVEGDILIPIGQGDTGHHWYMVKTQKGVIGWIKSADVQAKTTKKP